MTEYFSVVSRKETRSIERTYSFGGRGQSSLAARFRSTTRTSSTVRNEDHPITTENLDQADEEVVDQAAANCVELGRSWRAGSRALSMNGVTLLLDGRHDRGRARPRPRRKPRCALSRSLKQRAGLRGERPFERVEEPCHLAHRIAPSNRCGRAPLLEQRLH